VADIHIPRAHHRERGAAECVLKCFWRQNGIGASTSEGRSRFELRLELGRALVAGCAFVDGLP
jgi:hypothetical protein